MPDEYVVLDGYAFTNEGVARNLAALPNASILLHFNESTYLGFVANFTAVEINEFGKANIFPQLDVWSNR